MAAYERIYTLHINSLYEYGSRFGKDEEIVKDCIQDLFVKIWTNRNSLTDVISIRNYLFTSLRGQLFNRLEREKKIIYDDNIEDNYDFEMVFPTENRLIAIEKDKRLTGKMAAALDKLSPRQKESIYLRFYEGLSYPELAQVMNISVKSSYKLIAKALDSLKEHVDPSDIYLFLLSVYK
ncbi:RNA polymerase sigma factor CnrH [compost metagenome]